MSPTQIKLLESHQNLIRQHIDANPDVEVCGLVGGVWQPYPQVALAKQVVQVPNVAHNPHIAYHMDERIQVETMLAFEKQGWQTIGIYHSHPQGEAVPSPSDIQQALYPDTLYLIGIPQGNWRVWRIVRGQIHEGFIKMC